MPLICRHFHSQMVQLADFTPDGTLAVFHPWPSGEDRKYLNHFANCFNAVEGWEEERGKRWLPNKYKQKND